MNEEENLPVIVRGIKNSLKSAEILICEGPSKDDSARIADELAKDPKVSVIHMKERGYGRAVKTGLKEAKTDKVVVMMSDLSDDPKDLPKIVEKLDDHDVVIGSRFVKGGKMNNYPFMKHVANRAFNNFARILFGYPYKDTTNSFKGYRKEILNDIELESNDFDVTAELLLKAHRKGCRITEVPVTWTNRVAGKANLNLRRVGGKYLRTVLKTRFGKT